MDSQSLGSAEMFLPRRGRIAAIAAAESVEVEEFIARVRGLAIEMGFDRRVHLLAVSVHELAVTTANVIPICAAMVGHINVIKKAAAQGTPRDCGCLACLRFKAPSPEQAQSVQQDQSKAT